jgi:hypothetical protein
MLVFILDTPRYLRFPDQLKSIIKPKAIADKVNIKRFERDARINKPANNSDSTAACA